MPLLLFRLGIGAHETEAPVGVMRGRCPELLAIDDVVVAVANSGRAQRSEVGARARFGEALAKPVIDVGDARQKVALLFLGAERDQRRPDHVDVERERLRRRRHVQLFLENVLLNRVPARAAPFGSPGRRRPALLVEDARPANQLFLRNALPEHRLASNVLGQRRAKEFAHLVTKLDLFGCEAQVHQMTSSRCRSWRQIVRISSHPATRANRSTVLAAVNLDSVGVGVAGTVRLNRGAGAGCTTPSTSTNVPRACRCSCSGASAQCSTGATHASVRAKMRSPFVARLGFDALADRALCLRPRGWIVLRPELRRIDAEHLQELRVELAFDGADREPFAIRAFVDVIEMRAGIRDVRAALEVQHAGGVHTEESGRERGRAIDDGRIDDLAFAGALRFEMPAQMPSARYSAPPP